MLRYAELLMANNRNKNFNPDLKFLIGFEAQMPQSLTESLQAQYTIWLQYLSTVGANMFSEHLNFQDLIGISEQIILMIVTDTSVSIVFSDVLLQALECYE